MKACDGGPLEMFHRWIVEDVEEHFADWWEGDLHRVEGAPTWGEYVAVLLDDEIRGAATSDMIRDALTGWTHPRLTAYLVAEWFAECAEYSATMVQS
jgi:hypothetical protein